MKRIPTDTDTRTAPAIRVAIAATGLAAAAAVLGACSSSASPGTSPSTAQSPTAGPTSPPSTTAGGTVSGSGGSGGSTGSGAADTSSVPPAGGGQGTVTADPPGNGAGGKPIACTEDQLKASIDPRTYGKGVKNDFAIVVDFTNTSNATCTLYGYPGAALENSSNKQVKQATRTLRGTVLGLPVGQNSLPTVVLQPGKVASAGLEGVNQQEQGAAQAGCDDSYYPRVLVTPPNTKTPVPFTIKWPVCYSFTVHPTNIEKNPPK